MRILSGIQPSGTLHLGNYFGAIQQHVELQETAGGATRLLLHRQLPRAHHDHDAARLRALTRDVAIDYLALGLDPAKATFFRQSDVPEVYGARRGCSRACVGKGLLERAHSYKDKVAQGLDASMGLFNYPVLMAADILIYRSNARSGRQGPAAARRDDAGHGGELQRRVRARGLRAARVALLGRRRWSPASTARR